MSKRVTYKFPGQRKERRWFISHTDGIYHIQADGCCGQFDEKGRGVFTTKGEYFHHLAQAESYTFPMDFVEQAVGSAVQPGEVFGGIVTFTGVQTIDKDGEKMSSSRKLVSNFIRWALGKHEADILAGKLSKEQLIDLAAAEYGEEAVAHLREAQPAS